MKQGHETSRRLPLAQSAVTADAAGAGRIIRAAIAGAAGGDVRREQRLHREAGALVDRQGAALKPRDSGLIQSKPLAHFDLRQPELAPDVSEVVHGNR